MIGSTHDYTADYHMGHLILRLLVVGGLVQAGWLSVWAEGYCSTAVKQE
jgi:hypothetical protein